MCAVLIGGMDRLNADYMAAAGAKGWQLRCISRNSKRLQTGIGAPDLILIFTSKVSHEAKRKAQAHGRKRNIPVRLVHSCGVSSLRDSLPSLP